MDDILAVMIKDKSVRRVILKKIHKFFFYFFFPHYTEFPIAPFHEEIFHITEDTNIRSAVILGFRGCGKSSLLALSYVLWAILGEQKIKYIVILSKTQQKAQTLLQHIKYEFQTNDELRKHFGPFEEERIGLSLGSLYIPRYDAKITAASTEQSIRGLRHKQYRPQLVLCDDLEDMDSVRTKEGRDKLYDWLVGDVLPAGTKNARLIITGSLLHEDCIIKRLQKNIAEGKMSGIYREYPILDKNGKPLWPGKYPDQKSIDEEKGRGITEAAWQREYMLDPIVGENQIVHREWLHYYDKLPDREPRFVASGIDPAIGEKNSNDFTAIVSAKVFGRGENLRTYIMSNMVNKQMDFPKAIAKAKDISLTLGNGVPTWLFIETGGYQKAMPDQLKNDNFPAEEFKHQGNDKFERLSLVTPLIQSGKVLFPRTGAENLITQMIGLGRENHDDLVDAFTALILKIIERDAKGNKIPGCLPLITGKISVRNDTKIFDHSSDAVLGIVLPEDGRKNMVIVKRTFTDAWKIFEESVSGPLDAIRRVIEIAKKHMIPLDGYHIIFDRSGNKREFAAKFKESIESRLLFGVDLMSPIDYMTRDFANLCSKSYWDARKWLEAGNYVDQEIADNLQYIQYRQQGGKIEVANYLEMIKNGFESPDIADAFMLTFAHPIPERGLPLRYAFKKRLMTMKA